MKRFSTSAVVFLAVDIALLIICLLRIPDLRSRASVPFALLEENHQLVVGKIQDLSACPDLREGDHIAKFMDESVRISNEVEYLADFLNIGDTILISYQRGDILRTAEVKLVAYYDLSYVIIVLFIGIVTWCVGVYVLIRRQGEFTAGILHWALISLGVSVILAWEGVTPHSLVSYVGIVVFFASYISVAATFFFFTTMFPSPKPGSLLLKMMCIYVPAVALMTPLVYFQVSSISLHGRHDLTQVQTWFDLFYVALFVYIGGGIFNFVHSYITSTLSAERRKLQWILFGLCTGPTPFLVFTVLPRMLGAPWAVPEEYTLLFLLLIPFTFAISFIRFHLLDIEVVINRATVYVVAITVLLAIYALLVGSVAMFLGSYRVEFSAVAAVVVALMFEPARRRVQQFVDRRFFRVRYDFREAERKFFEEMKYALNIQQLAQLMVRHTYELIPVDRIGFFAVVQPGNRLHAITQMNFELPGPHSVHFEAEKLKSALELPVALNEVVESGVPHDTPDVKVFHRWGVAIVFPMLSESREALGFLVLGRKKSGARYTLEDVDLLRNAAAQAGLALERIKLQQELLLEHAEARRLDELNKLKSDFVSYVSHELRTPLTSIKMFSELLMASRGTRGRKSQEYLHIIQGESERLDRMVNTILDSARIEQGVKEYHFAHVDLGDITTHVMDTMKYQLDKHKFKVQYAAPRLPLLLSADPEAIAQAQINLIVNAIKYSTERKYLGVKVKREGAWAVCSVRDHGPGISLQALPHLFEKFYRDPAHRTHSEGVGLGLPLVKHIMDAHGGRVEVQSKVGRGSLFSLWFPLKRTDHEPEKENSHR